MRASQRRLGGAKSGKGMVMPFQPLAMAFHHIYYSVDLPSVRHALSPCTYTLQIWHICMQLRLTELLESNQCVVTTVLLVTALPAVQASLPAM